MQEQENSSEIRTTKTIQEEIRLITEESKLLYERLKASELSAEQRQEFADSLAMMDEAYMQLANELQNQSLIERTAAVKAVAHEAEEVLGGIAARGQDVKVPDPITGQPITMGELKEHNEAVNAGAIDASR